jgi:hypothetical protein
MLGTLTPGSSLCSQPSPHRFLLPIWHLPHARAELGPSLKADCTTFADRFLSNSPLWATPAGIPPSSVVSGRHRLMVSRNFWKHHTTEKALPVLSGRVPLQTVAVLATISSHRRQHLAQHNGALGAQG